MKRGSHLLLPFMSVTIFHLQSEFIPRTMKLQASLTGVMGLKPLSALFFSHKITPGFR
jgi:hypothetical protein